MHWLILNIFGGPLGINKRFVGKKKGKKRRKRRKQGKDEIPALYIRKTELKDYYIAYLSMLIISIGVVTVSSSLNLSLLRITHVCSEDPQIDCYPLLINDTSEAIFEDIYNTTIDTDKPITDCSFWNSEGVSREVTFVCYQLVYNVQVFLAAAGGLLKIFPLALKLLAGILLCFFSKCLNCKCCSHSNKFRFHCILLIFATVTEMGLALASFVFGVLGVSSDEEEPSPVVKFFGMHASGALLVFGVFSTLLIFPWESIVKPDKNKSKEIHSIV